MKRKYAMSPEETRRLRMYEIAAKHGKRYGQRYGKSAFKGAPPAGYVKFESSAIEAKRQKH